MMSFSYSDKKGQNTNDASSAGQLFKDSWNFTDNEAIAMV